MKKVKIGFLPLYVKLYDDGSPNMRLRIDAFAKEVIELFKAREYVEIVASDICRLEDEFKDAITLFEKEKVDSIETLQKTIEKVRINKKVRTNKKECIRRKLIRMHSFF